MEYKLLHNHYDKIIDMFTNTMEPHSLADRLYSAQLIDEGIMEEASEAGVEKMIRIERLVSAVQTRVERDPSNFYHFVNLMEDLPEAESLLKQLQGLKMVYVWIFLLAIVCLSLTMQNRLMYLRSDVSLSYHATVHAYE